MDSKMVNPVTGQPVTQNGTQPQDQNKVKSVLDAPAEKRKRSKREELIGEFVKGDKNIGLCECLDLFSAFGAFSAAPTSYDAGTIAAKLKGFPEYDIRFFYNICGTEDGIAYASASKAGKDILQYTDRLDQTNYLWQERKGGHDFNIWNLGLYNFLKIIGRPDGK